MARRPDIDILIRVPGWHRTLPSAAAVCRRAVTAALRAGRADADPAEVSVVLTNDAEVRALNRRYRGRNVPTNVLSFPNVDAVSTAPVPPNGPPGLLGDVVVAYETTVAEAAAAERDLRDHLSHLVVHGTLHLLGYDHCTEAEANDMERLEIQALASIGVPDPFESADDCRYARAHL